MLSLETGSASRNPYGWRKPIRSISATRAKGYEKSAPRVTGNVLFDVMLSAHPASGIPAHGGRYREVSKLGAGGMGVVYRAQDRLTGHEVALKRLAFRARPASGAAIRPSLALAATQAPGLDALDGTLRLSSAQSVTASIDPGGQALRLALAQEFQILASLHHPLIIRVLDYGFDAQLQPYYVMELLQGAQPLTQYAARLPERACVALLVQLTQALVYLHRRGVLHRDLKPANILVCEDHGAPVVRVLDFGLAVLHQQRDERMDAIAGTLGYMAPELFSGAAASEAADVYSLGVLAVELLTGTVLFPQREVSDLIAAVLRKEPIAMSPALAPAWHTLLGRALSQQPEDRPSALEFLHALEQLGGAPSQQTEPIRESFLQSATLVGRQAELQQLRAALLEARQGHCQLLLIGGESGVGKSRLCEELRTQALTEGVLVLRAQVSRDVGGGLGIFADALRMQSLSVPLNDLESRLIKTLVPDLPLLLERDIEDAPPLDAQSARLRLLQILEEVLLRGSFPKLLWVEDLHWADKDALELLESLAGRIRDQPLLILCTFRDDERPDLPSLLPSGRRLHLPRLSTQDIGALSVAMLGEAGSRAGLIDLLRRETEGNTFFIIEIMRALAVEAGGLERVGLTSLPERMVTGGMQAVLERRWISVPAELRPLLRTIAVAGRQLDLGVLRTLHSELDHALHVCADAAVLEVNEGTWRFSHDKLREHILAAIDANELGRLHGQVADGVMAIHADDTAYAGTLAYHCARAGRPILAAQYADQAGAQALHRGALTEAVEYLEQALALYEQTQAPQLTRGRTLAMLVQAYFGLGKMTQASDAIPRAMAALGLPRPQSASRYLIELARSTVRQIDYQISRPIHPLPTGSDERLRLQSLCAVGAVALEVHVYESKLLDAALSMAQLANCAEQSGDAALRVRGYAGLAYLFSASPLHSVMRYFVDKVTQLEPTLADRAALCYAHRGCASAHLNAGEQATTLAHTNRARALAEELGDTYGKLHALGVCINAHVLCGRYEAAEIGCQEVLSLSLQVRHQMMQGLGWTLSGNIAVRRGNFAQASTWYEKTRPAGDAMTALVAIGRAGGTVLATVRQGARSKAIALLEPELGLLIREPATTNGFSDTYWMLAQAAFELWATASDKAEERRLHLLLERAIQVLWQYSLKFRTGKPGLQLVLGQRAMAQGRSRAAHRHFRSALQEATAQTMPHEAALARMGIGCLTPGAGGQSERAAATGLLRELHAIYDARESESALTALRRRQNH